MSEEEGRPRRRGVRFSQVVKPKPRMCACKHNTVLRKMVVDEDIYKASDIARKRKMEEEFVFEAGDGNDIDIVKSVEQCALKVVLLDMNANPRYQEKCKKCGHQIPISKLTYQLPSDMTNGLESGNANGESGERREIAKVISGRNRSGISGSTNANTNNATTSEKSEDKKNNDDPPKCTICNKTFPSRKSRNMHVLGHKNDKKHQNVLKNELPKRKRAGRPRARLLVRKKLKTKPKSSTKNTKKRHLKSPPAPVDVDDVNGDDTFPGDNADASAADDDGSPLEDVLIDGKRLVVRVSDMRTRLSTVVGKDGKICVILKQNNPE